MDETTNWCDFCGAPINEEHITTRHRKPICTNCSRIAEGNAMPRCDMCGEFTPREETVRVSAEYTTCQKCNEQLNKSIDEQVTQSNYRTRLRVLDNLLQFNDPDEDGCTCEMSSTNLRITGDVSSVTYLLLSFVPTCESNADVDIFLKLTAPDNMIVEAKTETMFEYRIVF